MDPPSVIVRRNRRMADSCEVGNFRMDGTTDRTGMRRPAVHVKRENQLFRTFMLKKTLIVPQTHKATHEQYQETRGNSSMDRCRRQCTQYIMGMVPGAQGRPWVLGSAIVTGLSIRKRMCCACIAHFDSRASEDREQISHL